MVSRCECNLPEDHFAQEVWHCRVREDGSVVAYERCPYGMAARIGGTLRERMQRAGVPEHYLDYTREAWEAFEPWPTFAAAHVVAPGGFAYIHGPNGTGKTHLAVAILGELLMRGVPGRYVTAKLLPELNPERIDTDRETEEKLRTVRVLVLDDLFSESNFKADRVRNLVEVRWASNLATLVTSMRSPAEAVAIDSDLGSRACSGVRIRREGVDRRLTQRTTAAR